MIQRNDSLRRNRKALLSDLSSLVKTGKTLEIQRQNTFTMESEPLANETVDEMLLKAFKIVTRGVKFLDAFLGDSRSEHIMQRFITVLADEQDYDPSISPAEVTTLQNAHNGCDAVSRRLSARSYNSAGSSAQTEQQDQTRRLSYRSQVHTPSVNSPGLRHSSMQLRRSCLSPDPARPLEPEPKCTSSPSPPLDLPTNLVEAWSSFSPTRAELVAVGPRITASYSERHTSIKLVGRLLSIPSTC